MAHGEVWGHDAETNWGMGTGTRPGTSHRDTEYIFRVDSPHSSPHHLAVLFRSDLYRSPGAFFKRDHRNSKELPVAPAQPQ